MDEAPDVLPKKVALSKGEIHLLGVSHEAVPVIGNGDRLCDQVESGGSRSGRRPQVQGDPEDVLTSRA